MFGIAYGISFAPSTEVASIPFLIMTGSKEVPAMIDWPTIVCCQAIRFPFSSSPADIRSYQMGR